jgi:hypothetical protein
VEATYEWFRNEWVNLVAIHPRTRAIFKFTNGGFEPYAPVHTEVPLVSDILPLLEERMENHPICLLQGS